MDFLNIYLQTHSNSSPTVRFFELKEGQIRWWRRALGGLSNFRGWRSLPTYPPWSYNKSPLKIWMVGRFISLWGQIRPIFRCDLLVSGRVHFFKIVVLGWTDFELGLEGIDDLELPLPYRITNHGDWYRYYLISAYIRLYIYCICIYILWFGIWIYRHKYIIYISIPAHICFFSTHILQQYSRWQIRKMSVNFIRLYVGLLQLVL